MSGPSREGLSEAEIDQLATRLAANPNAARAYRYFKDDRLAYAQAAAQRAERASPYERAGPKIGRNDPCPCGSGKKYKRCCGAAGAEGPAVH